MSSTSNQLEITDEVERYSEKLRISFAYVITITFLLVFSILTVIYFFNSFRSFVVQACFLLLCVFALLIIYLKKNYKLVFIIYSISGVVFSSLALVFIHDSVHFVEILWMLASISIAFYFIGKKLGFILLISSLIAMLVFIFYSVNYYIIEVTQLSIYEKFTLTAEMILGFGLNIYLFYIYIKINNYTTSKLKEANSQLSLRNLKIKQQNEDKTLLIKEVYHRVKNNLQIIISLLRIQSGKIKNKDIKEYFQESINQIMAISLVHQKLYKSDNLSQIKFYEYAHDLIGTIISTDVNKREIQLDITSKIDKVGLESLVHIGLIINELTLNSLKHAFASKKTGKIELNIRGDLHNEWVYMLYADNGLWESDKESDDGFGQDLIEALVEQLNGAYKIKKKKNGTFFLFKFKNTLDLTIYS